MRISIHHNTTYHYSDPVGYGLQRLRMTPLSGPGQRVVDWSLDLVGCHQHLQYDDHYGNRVTLVGVGPESDEVRVTAGGTVETEDNAGVVGRHGGAVPLWLYVRPTELTTAGDRIRALADAVRAVKDDVERMHALLAAVSDVVDYRIGGSETSTPAEQAVRAGQGVCQDHAQIFISAARLLDTPCRYVSGYLLVDDSPTSSASHAWAEAHLDGLGWVGFDVSNGISADERYVRLAVGRDSREAAPLIGVRYGAGREELRVDLQVVQAQQ